MAERLKQENVTYYTYKLNDYENQLIVAVLHTVSNQVDFPEQEREDYRELLKVFMNELER